MYIPSFLFFLDWRHCQCLCTLNRDTSLWGLVPVGVAKVWTRRVENVGERVGKGFLDRHVWCIWSFARCPSRSPMHLSTLIGLLL